MSVLIYLNAGPISATHSHQETANADIGTKTFSHSRAFPEYPEQPMLVSSAAPRVERQDLPVLVAVHDSGHDRVRVGARADKQENHHQ